MFEIKLKDNAKWYKIRSQISRLLFYLGKKIDPSGPYTNAHLLEVYTKAMLDNAVYGRGVIKIEHVPHGTKEYYEIK